MTLANGSYYAIGVKMGKLVNLSVLTSVYMAQDGDVLTGSTRYKIRIPAGATVTLNNATITQGGIVCAGKAIIVLVGTNSSRSIDTYAGIEVGGSGTTLAISGTGSLTAKSEVGAGIGSFGTMDGNLTITGGTINATGGTRDPEGGAAGIGSGGRCNMNGTITISGGTVTATGGNSNSENKGGGAGIGSGGFAYMYDYSNIIIASTVAKVTAVMGSGGQHSIGAGGGGLCYGTISIGGTSTGPISDSPYTYPSE